MWFCFVSKGKGKTNVGGEVKGKFVSIVNSSFLGTHFKKHKGEVEKEAHAKT